MGHLLTHTGGWQGDFFPDTGNGDDALARYVRLLADLPQLTPLGTVWSYNNAGFSIAGRVIERMGTTYEAALKQLVLEPLRLTRSYLFPTEVMVHGFAAGHAGSGDKPVVLQPWPIVRGAVPAGRVVASMTDQLRYARFHLGDGSTEGGGRLLSRESIELMQSPPPRRANTTSVSLGGFAISAVFVAYFMAGSPTASSRSSRWCRNASSALRLRPIP
jgi:CubicO group peptidase (beta-lactamase class C family)